MSHVLMCLVLFMLSQNWDRPEMEATDLAAPGAMQQKAETHPQENSEDLSSVPLTPQPVPKSETRWEYDDDGKPVARVVEETAPPPKPKAEEKESVEAPKKTSEEKKEAKPQRKSSERVATFWFLMPRN